MTTVRPLAAAALLVAVAAAPSFATIINTPGTYSVSVAVDTSLLPVPVPGLPALGPNVYSGTVIIASRSFGYSAQFRGTSATGDELIIKSRFAHGWFGLTVSPLVIGGQVVPDAVIGLDGASLISMEILGVGLVDGVRSDVKAKVGAGPVLKNFIVTPL
jgi:hypothetical protein